MIDMTNIMVLPNGGFRVRVMFRGEKLGGNFATLDEAIEVRDALKRKIVDGELIPGKGSSAIDLGPRFLASRGTNRSIDDDEGRWTLHIKTATWARYALRDVTRKHGVEWLAELKSKMTAYEPKTHGARRPKPLSVGLRRHCLNLARRFFAWAIDQEIATMNPFLGLTIEREDGDEDEGYQEDWYLDASEQMRLFDLWATLPTLNWRDHMERFIYGVALWSGLRLGELWCLHLSDFHVDGPDPHILVRYGSWDPIRERYRSPKGRKGEKRKKRSVPLWGFGLECAKAWLEVRAEYLKMTPKTERERAASGYVPSPLDFPTERGNRRDTKPPRSWRIVIEAFGVVLRIGEKPWWHLLRHSCASSMVSGAWGERWVLEDVQAVLGHADIRTTQVYAHLAPSAVQASAARAEAAFRLAKVISLDSRRGKIGFALASGPSSREAGETGHARQGSNLRPTAPEGGESSRNADVIARAGNAVATIRHTLVLVADGAVQMPDAAIRGLEVALDEALALYAAAVATVDEGGAR